MKKIILSVLLLGLSGCSMVDAYLMAKFDPNEYMLIDEIKSIAEVSPTYCTDRDKMNNIVGNMYLKAVEFKNYTVFIPHNEKTIPLAKSLLEEITALQVRYSNPDKIGNSYCKMKLNVIEKSAETIQEVIGSKPR